MLNNFNFIFTLLFVSEWKDIDKDKNISKLVCLKPAALLLLKKENLKRRENIYKGGKYILEVQKVENVWNFIWSKMMTNGWEIIGQLMKKLILMFGNIGTSRRQNPLLMAELD